MNTKRYASRAVFWSQVLCAILAVLFAVFFAAGGFWLAAGVVLTLFAVTLNRPQARFCAVTLSVPEILTDVMDAFKLRTPQLFLPGGFGTDFSSKTAVLGDKVTAKIEHLPLSGVYNAAAGGFKAATQDVTTIIEDVPVLLNQFAIVTVKIPWLTQLASKIELYKRAISNYGYVLGKQVVDFALASCTPGNFSNQIQIPLANINLDTFDNDIRNALNLNKISDQGRYCLLTTPAAGKLGSDDRVRSALFYQALNGGNGFRTWRDIAGFGWVREYPDLNKVGNNLIGFMGDSRAIAVATRKIDYSNAADQLGVPKVMEFYPMDDPDSGISMTGVAWQEPGTGDVYVSCGVLFGVGSGNQGGAAGSITDPAGLLLIQNG